MRTLMRLFQLAAAYLSKLSVSQLATFRNGLVFRNNGVASIYYGPIMETLSEDKYVDVMALFGLDVQNGFWYGANSATNRNNVEEPIDYKGYYCEKEHSCYESKIMLHK